jgi:hypothetical protein
MATRVTSKRRMPAKPSACDDAHARANAYCLTTYGDAYVASPPRPLALPSGRIWVSTVMLTSPGYGPVGDVGVIGLDGGTRAIVDATPKAEVRAAGVRLAREKRDALSAAFRRARTA